MERYFDIYLNAGNSVPVVINANQYDASETWIFTLYTDDNQQYTPASGSIVGLKSDGHTIANAGTVNSSGQVVITETTQMTASAGINVFELVLDGNHGTANFVVLVEPRPGDNVEPSDSDLSLMEQAIAAAGSIEAVSVLQQAVNNVSSRMEEFIADHAGLSNETVLWTGDLYRTWQSSATTPTGGKATLSQKVTDFDYIGVYTTMNTLGNDQTADVHWYNADEFADKPTMVTCGTTKAYSGTTDLVAIPYITLLMDSDEVTCTVFNAGLVSWNGQAESNATSQSSEGSNNYQGSVVKIVGVKNTQTDTEVTDARVGADGTIYSTLKGRLDAENSSLKSALDEITVGSGEATDGMLKPVTLHTIEAEADEVLTNTRVLSNSASTVNGYNTYLISFEQITQPVINRYGTVAANGWQYWGFYKGTGSSRTYLSVNTFTTYIIQPRSDYDGIFFSNNTGKYSMELITGVDVITNDGYPCDRVGFTSVSSEYCPFVAYGNEYVAIKVPKTDTRVYQLDVGALSYANKYYKSQSETSSAISSIGTMTEDVVEGSKKLTFANLSGISTLIVVRANQQDSLRSLCERGIYMYALTNPEAVSASRKKLPLQMIVHACNSKDTLLMALANGWGGAEFDVRTTSDGKYVLSHETTIGGMTISSETYATLAGAMPNILTVDEMIKYSAPFDFWLDMHFGGVSTEAEKLQLLRNGLACTDKVGYWTGAVNVQYYKKGLCYGFGYGTTSAPDSTDDDRAFNYYIGERSDLDIEKPFRYFAKDLGSGSSVSISNIKSGTYAGYSFVTAYYSVNSSQIYLE